MLYMIKLSFFFRYVIFLRKVFTCKNLESVKTQKLICQRNDLSLLHYLYIFSGTIPQIILQTYAILMLNENYHTKGKSEVKRQSFNYFY